MFRCIIYKPLCSTAHIFCYSWSLLCGAFFPLDLVNVLPAARLGVAFVVNSNVYAGYGCMGDYVTSRYGAKHDNLTVCLCGGDQS